MGIFQQFPYSNFHEMNLDQIIKMMREMQDEWEETKTEWASYKDFIDNYFATLNLSAEVLQAIQTMAARGELSPIIDPTIISETSSWLAEHITTTTGVTVIDDTLSIVGAAADAYATGFRIDGWKNDMLALTDSEIYSAYSKSGTAIELGNLNNYRWFYPITIFEPIESLTFWAIHKSVDHIVHIEFWEVTDTNLNKIHEIQATVKGGTIASDYMTVPIHFHHNKPVIISLTSDSNVVGGVTNQGAEQAWYITNKVDSLLLISNLVYYGNSSILGNINLIKTNKNVDTAYSNTDTPQTRLGNANNWRWFYPPIEKGVTLESVTFYAMPRTNIDTVNIEIWRSENNNLVKVNDVPIIVGGTSRYIKVPMNIVADTTLWVSVTNNPMNVIGAYLSTGTELAYYVQNKIDNQLALSDVTPYYNASISGMLETTYRNDIQPDEITVPDDYSTFIAGIEKANESTAENVILHVKPGVYDLISEYGLSFLNNNNVDGPTITRDMTIIFDSGASVVANYTGTNDYIKKNFSLINTRNYNVKLINATLEAANIRYCVHDEHGSNARPYTSEYINCKMDINNVNNPIFTYANCIGMGLGKYADIRIHGGLYTSTRANDESIVNDNVDIRIHNSNAANAESRITIDAVYCKKGVGIFSNGSTQILTDVFVSNSSFKRDVYEGMSTGATIDNMNVIKWNNEIRN